jgi:serine/threonine protein phosphatase 1
MAGPIYFAIGDVHGEAAKLHDLHQAILERILFERSPARIIHLGDYVDRGPDSCGVIEQLLALEKMFEGNAKIQVISLMGNHEQMMIDAHSSTADVDSWWSQGGAETADSYAGGPGLADANWRETIPSEHIDWLRRLPTLFHDQERRLAFVHAGIDPRRFPACPEMIRLWTRSDRFFNTADWPDREELNGLTVIHGHTPQSFEPEVEVRRINVDTGACFGGPLTAVVLKEGEALEFLRAN